MHAKVKELLDTELRSMQARLIIQQSIRQVLGEQRLLIQNPQEMAAQDQAIAKHDGEIRFYKRYIEVLQDNIAAAEKPDTPSSPIKLDLL